MAKFEKGHPKYGGRKRGTPNKTTIMLKEAILKSFESLGGVDYLERLAKDEPRAYAQLLGRILPSEIKAEISDFAELIDAIAAARKRATGR